MAESTFNVKMHRSTISRIISHFTERELPIYNDAKRLKSVRYPQFEEELKEWFLKYQNIATISENLLKEKVEQLLNKQNIKDLKLSNGWLQAFKTRHNIKCYRKHGEDKSTNESLVIQELPKLQELIKDYEIDDVYNFDETALFYRLEPDQTLATHQLSGKKKNKERITIGNKYTKSIDYL